MPSPKARVQLFDGDSAGAYKDILPPGCFIGREEDNDIRLSGEGVSRYHAKIELDDKGEWIVRDLGSSNGTKVNSKKIDSTMALKSGDLLSFGSDKIRFEIVEKAPETGAGRPEKKASPFQGDEKVELYVRTRIKQELEILAEKLRTEKERRLKSLSIGVLVGANLIILLLFLLYIAKSKTLKAILQSIADILEKLIANM